MPSSSRGSPSLDADARNVLRLSATGLTTAEVAAQLGMTPKQVRRHLGRAIVALQASSTDEAASLAIRLRLWHLPDQ